MPSCRAGSSFFPKKGTKNSSLKNFAQSNTITTDAKFYKATFFVETR